MDQITIVPYERRFQRAFKELNEAWIRKYFKMEEEDYKALDHPEEKILNPGGAIFVALHQGEAVGVCALVRMIDFPYDYELAKMGVAPEMQGRGIGYLLGRSIIDKARELGGKTLYLESNTVLKPAMRLYEKLGFRQIDLIPSPYSRCNIQMVLDL